MSIISIASSALVIMTPILFAATGGLFTAHAGMLNIALEGSLLIGAFAAAATAYVTGSFAAGIAAAMLASAALSALHAFAALKLRANVFITGLAANLLAGGLTAVLTQSLIGAPGIIDLRSALRSALPAPGASIPGAFIIASWLLLGAAWLALYKTPFGYRLRACDANAAALESLGIQAGAYRWAAFLISGFFCGIGGAFLSLNLGAFVPNMSAGKGWIALVIIFLGGRRPLGLLAAAFAYGLAEAFSNHAQGLQFARLSVPADLVLALPYILTLLAMVLASIWEKRRPGHS